MRKVAHYFFYLPQNNHIYLPSRLIELGKKDDELAFILAHEIAHWLQGDMNTR
jgi:Zn-dependent protease with chaperone function